MKILSKAFQYVLVALGAVVFIVACATYAKSKSGVEMGQYYAIIYPDAKLPDVNCDAVNRVLKKYDKSLYKIQTYKDGKLIKARGQLAEKYMRAGLVAEVTQKAQTTNFTGCAIQAGSRSTTLQTMVPQMDEMVNKLRPTLEKYNKK
jgi:hypothetical protein